jgi:hypothetical protein
MSNARELAQIPSTPSGRRNLIINGAMNVAQRGTSETGVTTSGYYTVDRWKMNGNNGTWTVGQDTSTPNGFANSYKMTLTATEAIGSTSYMSLEQKMEGINLQSLAYGSSAAKDIILSFWVKSNITGNYCVNTYQDDGSSNYPETYTINTADTWEHKTIKYDGNTATSLDNDVNSSLRVIFFLVAASELSSGSTGSRVAYSADTYAAGQSAQIDAVNDYWQITGVQLEVGTVATEFEHRSFGEELALCQRYYYKTNTDRRATLARSDRMDVQIDFPVQMRTTPSISASGTVTFSTEQVGIDSMTFEYAGGVSGSSRVIGSATADAEL